jgi:hypothetical protein
MNDKIKTPSEDQSRRALDNPSQAIETELDVHEEFARAWATYMASTVVPENFLTKGNRSGPRKLPAACGRVDESFRLFEEGGRAGLRLLKQAVRGANADCLNTVLAPLDFLVESSLSSSRAAALGVIQFNVNTAECWLLFLDGLGLCRGKR